MGGFAAGFLNTLGERAQKKVQERNAQEQKLKDAQAQVYWDAISSGRLTPDQIDYAQKQLQKIYGHSKPIKEIFDKVGKAIGIVHGAGGQQGKQPQQQTAQAITPPPGVQAPAYQNPAAPAPIAKPLDAPPYQNPVSAAPYPGTQPPNVKPYQNPEPYVSPNGSVTPMPIPNATPQDAGKVEPIPNATEQNKGTVQPLSGPPKFSDFVAAAHPDPNKLAKEQQDSAFALWQRQQDVLHKNKMEEEAAKAQYAAANSGTKGIPRLLPPLSMTEAKGMAGSGQQFLDAAGNPIEVSAFDNTMQLVPVVQGTKLYYVPTSQHQTHLTVGNQVVAVPALEQMNAGKEGVVLGQARVPTSTTTTQHEFGTASATTPQTPGITGGKKSAQVPPAASGQSAIPGATKKSPAKVAPPPGVTQTEKPATGGLGEKVRTGAAYNQDIQANTVREASTQLFGDESQPNFNYLGKYSYIADDPQKRKDLAKAVLITFRDQSELGNKDAGDILTYLKKEAGVPQLLAEASADVKENAIGNLSPDLKAAYNAVMSGYGTIIGLRTLTKASGTQFSMEKIEQEMPIPGLNSFSSQQFNDQMSHLAQIIYNASKVMKMPEGEKDFYKKQVDQYATKGKKPNGKVSPPPGAKNSPKTAQEYLDTVNQ